jgi:2-keto-4-pentenoate hydratase
VTSAVRASAPGPAQLASLADRLFEAYTSGTPIAPLRDQLAGAPIDAAYAIQDINTKRWLAAGLRLVGRKIGLTAKSVQRQLGVAQPDYGMLFDRMAVPGGEAIPAGRLLQPKVEAEIAFVLERDLRAQRLTMADVINAVAYALPALEIVDSRIANWNIKILDTVADNASSGMFVLGERPVRLTDFDARLCGMTLSKNGESVSFGAGAAALGHPLNALLWLAEKMAAVGRPLVAGDVVLSGALGPMIAAQPGDRFEARISGLGPVAVGFASAVRHD